MQALLQHEALIRVLEEEREYYKKEYEALKALHHRSPTPVHDHLWSSPSKVLFLFFTLSHCIAIAMVVL